MNIVGKTDKIANENKRNHKTVKITFAEKDM